MGSCVTKLQFPVFFPSIFACTNSFSYLPLIYFSAYISPNVPVYPSIYLLVLLPVLLVNRLCIYLYIYLSNCFINLRIFVLVHFLCVPVIRMYLISLDIHTNIPSFLHSIYSPSPLLLHPQSFCKSYMHT